MEVPQSILLKSIHTMESITICTDASYDPISGQSAWACYIKTAGKTIKTGRIIEHEVINSTEAERVGVANALWLASKVIDPKNARLVFYCDNIAALKPVRSNNKTGTKKQRARHQLEFYQKNIEPYLQKYATYELRHVKSHLERSGRHTMKAKHYMNDWCDKECRRLIQEVRQTQ